MNQNTTTVPAWTIGIDLGDRYSHYCVMDHEGNVVKEDTLMTCSAAFEVDFAKHAEARIAIEVGAHSPWVSRQLESYGHEVIVANPRRLRLIYASNKKTDKVDARALARVARFDPELLSPVKHRAVDAQIDLELVRARDTLVRARTRLINHVRGAVKCLGGRLPKSSAPAFAKLGKHVPKELWTSISPLMDTIGALSQTIQKYDRAIEQSCEKHQETASLRQVKGVGPITALTFVLTIDDPTRFKKSRDVGPYLGLVPRQHESGQSKPQLGITRAGDSDLRRLLVGSAQYMLGPFGEDCDLRRWGLALVARGGKAAKKRAVVSVARRLAVLLHRLWVSSSEYEALRHANRKKRRPAEQVA